MYQSRLVRLMLESLKLASWVPFGLQYAVEPIKHEKQSETIMEWHWPEALTLYHHLPHSIGDLLHHEDKTLVSAGVPGIVKDGGGKHHRLILPDTITGGTDTSSAAPRVAIEKDMDPAISRSQQNLGLLMRDYLRSLPGYSAHSMEGEALLAHWRRILLEQPQRFAEAQMHSWSGERLRLFWQERLNRHKSEYDIDKDPIIHPVDDWERSAGAFVPPQKMLGTMKSKQWQDLVIRERLHKLDLRNTGITR